MLGVGGFSLESERTEELLDVERCLRNGPDDIALVATCALNRSAVVEGIEAPGRLEGGLV